MPRKVICCEPRSRGQQRHVYPVAKTDVPPDQPDRKEIKCEDMQIIPSRTIEPADRREDNESHRPTSNGCLIPGALRARRIGHCAIKYRKRSAVNPSPQPTLRHFRFVIRPSSFEICPMRASLPVTFVVLSALLFLGGCATPATTTVGVTTNEAPRFHEIGR